MTAGGGKFIGGEGSMLLPGTKPRRRPRTGEKKVFANQCFYGII